MQSLVRLEKKKKKKAAAGATVNALIKSFLYIF